jgi:hypothetical protein
MSGLLVAGISNSLIFWIDEIIETPMGDVAEETVKPLGVYTSCLFTTHRDFRSPRRVVGLLIRLTD